MPWQPLPSSSGGDPRPLGETVDRLVRSMGAPSADVTRSLFADWTEIVGAQLAAHARPHALRERTLVVAVSDPAWATQLRFLESELLDRIAAATGSDEVTAIEVRVRRERDAGSA
jgi:predicted nucleic acid-binding Zn ribbon protein